MSNQKLLDEYIANRITEISRDHQPTAEARAIGYVRQLLLEAGFGETLDAFDSIFEGMPTSTNHSTELSRSIMTITEAINRYRNIDFSAVYDGDQDVYMPRKQFDAMRMLADLCLTKIHQESDKCLNTRTTTDK